MRLLVGVATAAVFHGLVLGAGLLLLPRHAVPAPARAPSQVDVDVVAARSGADRSTRARCPGAVALAAPRAHRPQVRAQALSVAATELVPAIAPSQTGAGPIVASHAAPPAQNGAVTAAQPQYRSNPAPEYPIASHRRHEEGTVLLKVAVGADGLPTAVSLERSCGHRLLDDAALETVRRWTFAPARAGGVAIASVVVIPVRFAAAQADR